MSPPVGATSRWRSGHSFVVLGWLSSLAHAWCRPARLRARVCLSSFFSFSVLSGLVSWGFEYLECVFVYVFVRFRGRQAAVLSRATHGKAECPRSWGTARDSVGEAGFRFWRSGFGGWI